MRAQRRRQASKTDGRWRWWLGSLTGGCIAAAGLVPGCTQDAVSATLPSIAGSGPIAFLCLHDPAQGVDAALPLSRCSSVRTNDRFDYAVPHLYALVVQPVRGEVAVIDLTTDENAVIDSDPVSPAMNFLPVGAQPTAIAATPGSRATFVASAEVGHEGIFALPSTLVRGNSPRLSSWPACALPATPGSMTLAVDAPDADGDVRPSCDAAYGDPDPGSCEEGAHCFGELGDDATAAGKPGRYKLVVALPSEGGLAIIDAQRLLDQQAGAFEPCPIDRFVALGTDPGVLPVMPLPPSNGACVNAPPDETTVASFVSRPAGLAAGDRELFVADAAAPLIHRLDITRPCEPDEHPPLVPHSLEDPTRVVTTNRLAVSPLTIDLRRYLYAIDAVDGSIMTFDVSDDSLTRTPLTRSNPQGNPFQPPDRLRFQAPPREIVIVDHHIDSADDQTGATAPVRCDPDPNSSGPGTIYQTTPGFDGGAGPDKLRGIFALALLSSGEMVVVDVDDYDAPCRGPKDHDPLFGCPGGDTQSGLDASGEYSCNTSEPHQSRANGYLVTADGIAANQPGVATYPTVFDASGTALLPDDGDGAEVPRMRATVAAEPPPAFTLAVGGQLQNLEPATGTLLTESSKSDPTKHTLAFQLDEPRAHIVDQAWSVTYEGSLPGFDGRFASLVPTDAGTYELREASSRFCDRGVHGREAARLGLVAEGAADADIQADALADYVQVVSSSPVETDDYWSTVGECSYLSCNNTYGTVDQPRPTRDLRILEAYQDKLVLEPRASVPASAAPLKCCFRGVVEFRVRVGHQWAAIGNAVGFLHHVVADETTGTCRDECDPARQRLDGRVRDVPHDDVVFDGDPRALTSPTMRFAIQRGKSGKASERDTQFRFSSQGAFHPLVIDATTQPNDFQPQFATYLPPTGEIVVSDGSLGGVTFVSLSTLSLVRQYH